MKTTIALALLFVAAAAQADSRRFSAADVPLANQRMTGRGKIVIKNDARTISAFRFFGNVKEALVTLRATRSIAYRPFGAQVFNSGATVQGTGMPVYLAAMVEDAGRTHGVDPRLVAAVARRESAWNPNAVSPVGAGGLMQLMPATARFLGVSDVFDARQNVHGGTRYLRELLDTFHGDLDLALAAYNAGPGAVQKYNGIPPYRETQAYVRAVRASYESSLR